MPVSTFRLRRELVLAITMLLLTTGLVVTPAAAVPGVAPEIVSILDTDLDIDPGEARAFVVEVAGYDDGGSFEFSGSGLLVSSVRLKGDRARLQIEAELTAEAGLRDLTVINPDGLSDTYLDAILVTGNAPEMGDLTGHVFDDADGNGIEDGSDAGLVGVSVAVSDINGAAYNVTTDGSGDFSLLDLPVGDATVTYTTPSATVLTTANDVQIVTVVMATSVAAAAVGYQAIPAGDLTGHVFSDIDGNGVEDGGEVGLASVDVSVTDADGAVYAVSTDAGGDYTITGLAVGDADITYTTPTDFLLTTSNDLQTVNISDGALSTASDVGYEPPAGDLPVIVSIMSNDLDIDPGEDRAIRVDTLNYVDGTTFTFSGTGLTATVARVVGDIVRLAVSASESAEGGARDLTMTTPNGLSDTLVGALTVTGDIPPPINGDVTGHVFADLDANGLEDGSEVGLAGVAVNFVDAAAATWSGVTDSFGDFTLTVGIGEGTLTVTTPAGDTLTTANDVQILVITDGGTTVAAAVGYEPGAAPTGTFIDVSAAAGITTAHASGSQCNPPIGVGSAWADVDGDGDQDLLTTNRDGANHLYRNDGDTNGDGIIDFTDVAVALGIDASGDDSFAASFIDYDNDGDPDAFVANTSGNTLWQNQLIELGHVAFVDVSATAGLSDSGRIETATWGDVDSDGLLDVYFAKHMTCAGDSTDRLFHNNGDGTFTDWTTYLCAGTDPTTCDDVNGLGFAAGMFDFDADGDTDIYLVNDNITGSFQPNKLFRNDGSDGAGGWTFVEVGAASGAGLSVNGMGLAIGDYNNDGFFDLAFSDVGPGHLLMNNGDGTFTDVSGSSGITAAMAGGVSWGTVFMDYNNDGLQDLFFAQGTIGPAVGIANSLLENQGDGTFVDVTTATGMGDTQRGRNVSIADFDDDGWVDVFIGNYDASALLMQNMGAAEGNTNGWLTITVEGTDSNRDAIGAVIKVTTGAGTQMELITSGGNHGGGSQKAAFFGLGTATSATVTVTWPNGVVESLGSFASGQAVHLVEPAV